ncbi:protein ALWAYS EARLY 2-like isoform X2 [Magnolia sinica]|uniref:protein ALWAYS EARLY 2-like isoform X2 n=1 Tax=Magnolia sinica TaxID=86752 RepID=UPI00265B6D53|nr:protein ALWAYS EARLY 2-like isoform X2 [Magnolia sinica]
MAPTRKSRIKNKRFAKVNEVSPVKDGDHARKSNAGKRKSSDKSGSQWSREELECFYEAYRKYGKDWKKVASVIRSRSVDMVEALYSMNRAYLSLPDGTASVAGLIAMMTDHYNMLEGSDSERESNDGLGIACKPQKRFQGKPLINKSKGLGGPLPDLFQSVSTYGCLSLLKKKRSGGSRPRAVGKRTPRFPVSYLYGKDERSKITSPDKDLKSKVDAADEEVAHVAALALAEASQRVGSPQVSRTPSRRTDIMGERKCVESEMSSSKVIGSAIDENWYEGSPESRETVSGDLVKDTSCLMDREGAGVMEIQRKPKRFQGKKPKVQGIENNHFGDVKEACSGTEEGLALRAVKDEVETEVTDRKVPRSSPQGPRKRSRQLFSVDENSALDALQTLADLSLNILVPDSAIDSESSVRDTEEKRKVEKSSAPEAMSAKHERNKPKVSRKKEKKFAEGNISALKKQEKDSSLRVSTLSEGKQGAYEPANKMQKRKRKSLAAAIPEAEVNSDSHLKESQRTGASAEGKRPSSKAKCVSDIVPLPKLGKSVRSPELTSTDLGMPAKDLAESTVQVSLPNQVNLLTKLRSRRKGNLQKAVVRKETRSSENVGNDQPDKSSHMVHHREIDLKNKLFRCLSSKALRRWCAFEWFYSAIDYPWFARSEFVEYLNHVGLGHVPRLTRVEWGVIRSSLGKPRRLSKQFLREEREKLEQYRESVRTHYTEVRAGVTDGLATDLARPLSVGQRVIACHPRRREIHDGSVLTVDRNRCRVQFDQPELGVEFVMDIDCMPLNPLESLSEALRSQHGAVDKFHEKLNDLKLEPELKNEGSMKVHLAEHLENLDGLSNVALSNYPVNTLMKQAKGDTLDAVLQAKAAAKEIFAVQATCRQPVTLAQIQTREADIRALSDLTRALDKKEALLLELKHMNEEVLGNQKDGASVMDLDHQFKKQYATVLVQLKDANDQVGSALLYLRKRNTYHGNSMTWLDRPMPNSGHVPLSLLDPSALLTHDSGSHVVGIVESSRKKARAMVDAAMQAMSSSKEGEDAFQRIGEALDTMHNNHSGANSGVSTLKYFSPDIGHGVLATSCTSERMMAVCAAEPEENHASDGNGEQLPSELMSSCVASFLMIQTCTERQYPPAEVAQILDDAVTSLQPRCSQNLSIYREIQQCMGIVRNQILALIPT